jgi:hypothetical protein
VTGARYRIVVSGRLDAATLERLGRDVEVRTERERTELLCDVVDQSQLVGLLSGLSRGGVEVISATPLRPRDL